MVDYVFGEMIVVGWNWCVCCEYDVGGDCFECYWIGQFVVYYVVDVFENQEGGMFFIDVLDCWFQVECGEGVSVVDIEQDFLFDVCCFVVVVEVVGDFVVVIGVLWQLGVEQDQLDMVDFDFLQFGLDGLFGKIDWYQYFFVFCIEYGGNWQVVEI